MMRRKSIMLLCAAAATWVASGSIVHASLTIYGGGLYTGTGTGYQNASEVQNPGQTAGDGVGVGAAFQYSGTGFLNPSAALRFDNTGAAATQLGYYPSTATGTTAVPYAIAGAGGTASGTIVGSSNSRAVYWAPGSTTAVVLGADGFSSSGTTSGYASTINTGGSIGGQMNAYNSSGVQVGTRAIRWDAGNTTATELANLGTSTTGSTAGLVESINVYNVSAGYMTKYNTAGTSLGTHAVIWAAGAAGAAVTGSATELGNIGTSTAGSTTTFAISINSAGTTAGYGFMYNSSGTSLGNRGIVWSSSDYTTAIPLGTLGATTTGSSNALAYSINTSGTVVGTGTKYDANGNSLGARAIRWDSTSYGTAVELGNLGTTSSGLINHAVANEINDDGLIVGQLTAYNGSGGSLGDKAVVWSTNGAVVDINTLLSPADAADWNLTNAYSISSTDWVTGVGTYDAAGIGNASSPSYTRSFLIQISPSAIPEPGSLGLIAAAGSMMIRRRRA